MRNIKRIDDLLEEFLPDAKIQQDLATLLWVDGKDGSVEINEEWVTIPAGCELAITTKAYFHENYDINFGPFKVQIAIGGVSKHEPGVLDAKYCFACLYYNEEGKWFTVDFYELMR